LDYAKPVEKTYNVGRAGSSGLGDFIGFRAASCGRLDETHSRLEDAAHITTSIGRYSGKESLAGFGSQVGFLDLSFGGVLRWMLAM
jgi:hypothetical protein